MATTPPSSSPPSSSPPTKPPRPTAACIIIGDEVLTGKVHDTNSHALAKSLFAAGVSLTHIEVIPDVPATITAAVRRLSASHNHVFTSGGIGPTHDDVTYEAVADAFGLTTRPNEAVLARMVELQPDVDWTVPARRRMAQLPHPATLHWTEGLWVPTTVVGGNVFVLPGIPSLFSRMLDGVVGGLGGAGALERRVIYTRRGEGSIAGHLSAVADAFPAVGIGSYPRVDGVTGGWRVRVTVEAENAGVADEVAARVVEATGGELGALEPAGGAEAAPAAAATALADSQVEAEAK